MSNYALFFMWLKMFFTDLVWLFGLSYGLYFLASIFHPGILIFVASVFIASAAYSSVTRFYQH